ncbi:MAG: N-acetylglutaminylglutamine amidotransferase [Rickettsiales bacterium]|nr:N-acetylglutaminylglutamine amidotransferase [Rickettsiales bacterium]
MCGFAGEIRFDNLNASPTVVERMCAALAARGPDGAGIYHNNQIALGHRRLKIFDLTSHSSQPMVDSTLGLTIVYNGALYNYARLRDELIAQGYTFFSSGDTEVILKAFHAWGKECVKRFNGMFAFVIWERDSGTVTMVRDRLGIKPLYYHHNQHMLRFASTLPALLAGGDVDTSIDPVALHYYMTFHAVVPAPHTILNGVRKLPPATIATIDAKGNMVQETYWKLNYARTTQDQAVTEKEWIDQVEEALKTAVERRLRADVPVGVLLSGGLDSSLIVGLLHELGHDHVETFSIGFENVDAEEGNEFHYSDIIAEKYQTKHHKIFATHDKVHDNLAACVKAMSEPMVSHDVIGFYLLSQEVSRHVKVVQSGQGADEIFAGYHWYPPLLQAKDNNAVQTYAGVFFDRDFEEYRRVVHDDYVSSDHASAFIHEHFFQPNADDPIDKALRLDTTIMLVDDPVKRVDNMTMAWGLEARVPFLDHELVELAAKIPGQFKVKEGGKHILKEVGRRIIPHEVIDRPKGYFPVPALKYIEGEYLAMVQDILSAPSARQRGLFSNDYIQTLCTAPREHLTPLRGSKLWQMALLEFWLQEHGL